MKISTEVTVNTSRAQAWSLICDIDNAAKHISGIENIEVLERPDAGLAGLKWRETRTLFGKTAKETMWITQAIDGEYYETRAESHGAIYESRMSLAGEDGAVILRMEFSGKPQTRMAKIMSAIMSPLFKSATRKALHQDLVDLKRVLER